MKMIKSKKWEKIKKQAWFEYQQMGQVEEYAQAALDLMRKGLSEDAAVSKILKKKRGLSARPSDGGNPEMVAAVTKRLRDLMNNETGSPPPDSLPNMAKSKKKVEKRAFKKIVIKSKSYNKLMKNAQEYQTLNLSRSIPVYIEFDIVPGEDVDPSIPFEQQLEFILSQTSVYVAQGAGRNMPGQGDMGKTIRLGSGSELYKQDPEDMTEIAKRGYQNGFKSFVAMLDDIPVTVIVEYSPGRPAPYARDHDSPGFSDPGDPSEILSTEVSINGKDVTGIIDIDIDPEMLD